MNEIQSNLREQRTVNHFKNITVKNGADIWFKQGETIEVLVECSPQFINRVITQVTDETLLIAIEPDKQSFESHLRVYITAPDLNELHILGACKFQTTYLKTTSFAVFVKGSGRINIDNLQAQQINLELPGQANINISGQAQIGTIHASGAVNLNAQHLMLQDAHVQASGVLNGSLWASQTLTVDLNGVTQLDYFGEPTIEKHIKGLSKLNHAGKIPV